MEKQTELYRKVQPNTEPAEKIQAAKQEPIERQEGESMRDFSEKFSIAKINKQPVFTTEANIRMLLNIPPSKEIDNFYWIDGVVVGVKGREGQVHDALNVNFSDNDNKRAGYKWR